MARGPRLDQVLLDRGLADSPGKAKALILAGQVRVGGEVARQAAAPIKADAEVTVDSGPKYVSRAGGKLESALAAFTAINPMDTVVLDAGASTGGFTDCLLQRGAAKVFAVDVGYGQLDWKLRNDPRVVVMERTNVRHLATTSPLPERVDLVTADLSFIGLTTVLPALAGALKPAGMMVLMVKPQFELAREQVPKGGVVRDDGLRQQAADAVAAAAADLGLRELGRVDSGVAGPKGNREIFLWLGP